LDAIGIIAGRGCGLRRDEAVPGAAAFVLNRVQVSLMNRLREIFLAIEQESYTGSMSRVDGEIPRFFRLHPSRPQWRRAAFSSFPDFNRPQWTDRIADLIWAIPHRRLLAANECKRQRTRMKVKACGAHKSLEICERCRLWQQISPATPETSAA